MIEGPWVQALFMAGLLMLMLAAVGKKRQATPFTTKDAVLAYGIHVLVFIAGYTSNV